MHRKRIDCFSNCTPKTTRACVFCWQAVILTWFLPARRYACAGNSDRNVSVRPSVCPSRAGIVSKRRKLAAWFLHHPVAPRLQFSDAKFHHQILRGPPNGGLKQGSVGKIQRFSSFKRQYLENGSYYQWLIGSRYMGFRLTPRSMTLDDLELV